GRLRVRYPLATLRKLHVPPPPLLLHTPRIALPPTPLVPPAPVANDTHVAEVISAPQANDTTFTDEDLA
ncbi:patatin family protein, partial [Salmonella enterica subsp. enterica serovar Typhimurium]